jgi:hypothetical protein
MVKVVSISVAACLASSCAAFAPTSSVGKFCQDSSLAAISDRRQMLGEFLAGTAIIIGGASEANAASNPALETFKAKGGTSGSFIPGKGIRSHEQLLAASNPALETFKAKGGTKGSFIPGKGIRKFDDIMNV